MNKPTKEEVIALQDVRRFLFIRADEMNSIEKSYINERWPLVASLLTKLENQVSQTNE
jgi:hypothetical protein